MHETYNYTEIKTRESKLYEISGSKISSSGISMNYIKILFVVLAIFNIIGIAICFISGKNYYIPISVSPTIQLRLGFLVVMIGGPIGVSLVLKYIKIQNYTLLEFLTANLKKKEDINIRKKPIKAMRYKNKGFIENVVNIRIRRTKK